MSERQGWWPGDEEIKKAIEEWYAIIGENGDELVPFRLLIERAVLNGQIEALDKADHIHDGECGTCALLVEVRARLAELEEGNGKEGAR